MIDLRIRLSAYDLARLVQGQEHELEITVTPDLKIHVSSEAQNLRGDRVSSERGGLGISVEVAQRTFPQTVAKACAVCGAPPRPAGK